MTGSTLPIACALCLGAALLILPAAGQERSARGKPSCPQQTWPDRLQGVDPGGDLVLASGRTAKLADIRLPDDPPRRGEALAWIQARLGQPVLAQGGESPDRWGRVSARIRGADAADQVDFGQSLVEAGLALVDPAAAEAFCQPELLAFEETARERSLGVWTDDRYKPIDVASTESLRDRVGSFVLVEGRIRSVGERAQQTYLNFGGNWAEDFTIVIPHKTWKLMAGRGLGAEALKGRRIRARGILQSWQGTALTVVIPEMIERLDSRR
jgi:endonuclease YncB( thermonuclease family)